MGISRVRRQLNPQGVLQLNFQHYASRRMVGYIGESLVIEYDSEDDSKVKVFENDGVKFICIAHKLKTTEQPDFIDCTKASMGHVHKTKTKAFAEAKIAEAEQKAFNKTINEAVQADNDKVDEELQFLFHECAERYAILKDALEDMENGTGSVVDTKIAISDLKGTLTLLNDTI